MSTESVTIRNERLVFERNADIENRVDSRLKKRFGRGLFVQDIFETANEQIAIKLGASYPKDVSDRRERDKVMRYINLGDVATLYAEPTDEGYYTVELPERSELKEAAYDRRRELVDQLDWSMAKAIYEDVYQLNPVRNQLNSLIQIIRWLQREPELSVDRINRIQRGNTLEYLSVLDDLGFVELTDEMVRPGEKLEAAEIEAMRRAESNSEERSYDTDEYEKIAIGTLIQDGYNVLRDQLDLRMLSHFPKFANSYYYSAIQRGSHDVWLDKSALLSNLKHEWGDDVDPLQLEDKLQRLSEVDVLEIDGEYVRGYSRVYQAVSNDSGSRAIAD